MTIDFMTAEEKRKQLKPLRELEDLKRKIFLEKEFAQITDFVTEKLQEMAEEIKKAEGTRKAFIFMKEDVEKLPYESSFEKAIENLCKILTEKLGYKVFTYYYSKSWYYQSGKYLELTVEWGR